MGSKMWALEIIHACDLGLKAVSQEPWIKQHAMCM